MLTLWSFHSIRGGAGRSTAACAAASTAARSGRAVYLIELELSGGTSIVDRGCVEAPRWSGKQEVTRDCLEGAAPTGFWSVEDSMRRLRQRAQLKKIDPETERFVPMLNDYVLHATSDWDARRDVQLEALLWRHADEGARFSVIPASPLPTDAYYIEQVLMDESHSGFVEGRLERLLAEIATKDSEAVVVFDCPRGFHGLSRTVLSLGIRLSQEPKVSLAEDSYVPTPLDTMPVSWEATMLYRGSQEKVGLDRWVSCFTGPERAHVTCVDTAAVVTSRGEASAPSP